MFNFDTRVLVAFLIFVALALMTAGYWIGKFIGWFFSHFSMSLGWQ